MKLHAFKFGLACSISAIVLWVICSVLGGDARNDDVHVRRHGAYAVAGHGVAPNPGRRALGVGSLGCGGWFFRVAACHYLQPLAGLNQGASVCYACFFSPQPW